MVLFDQIGVHAVTSQEHVGGGGHRLLRAGTASRSLFDKDDGCGGERQSVCKGDELKGAQSVLLFVIAPHAGSAVLMSAAAVQP